MRLWAIANSQIFIVAVSTFLAAFAGTWGAQLLAERKTERRALLSEIRGTNAALGLAFTITNTYITTKKQHIRALVQDYEAQVAARQAHFAGGVTASPFSPFAFVWTYRPSPRHSRLSTNCAKCCSKK